MRLLKEDERMHHPDRWLAVLRIATGAWFLKAVLTKWVMFGGVIPVPMATQRWIETMPRILEGFAESNPLAWCRSLLEEIVLRNADLFGHLTAVGEGLVGIGLTFGLLTRTSSVGALFLLVSYELAAIGLPFSQHGLRLLMIVAVIAFFFTRAGNVWGLDAWIAKRFKTPTL